MEPLNSVGENGNLCNNYGEVNAGFPHKRKRDRVPALSLQGIYAKEMESAFQRDTCIPIPKAT